MSSDKNLASSLQSLLNWNCKYFKSILKYSILPQLKNIYTYTHIYVCVCVYIYIFLSISFNIRSAIS